MHTQQGQSYEVDRRVHYNDQVKVSENHLQRVEMRPSVAQKQTHMNVNYRTEKAVINERIVEKPIEVIVERPVP